ncbi:MAG: Eco57I restriction-modification methylase domain-containing protein, partial [Ktedonobacteraceae bacterium]
FKRLLHVWLSEYFGNKGAKHTTRMYADAIVANDYSTANKEDREAIEAALKLADTRHFFHWELEFPEVFFGKAKRKENGGFDAVVGNPPYFSISTTLSPQEVAYISQAYINVYTGNSDIMYYFLSLAPKLLKSGCFQGMIVSRYFQEAKYAERVRTYLSQTTSLVHLVDFQNFQIFGKEVNTLSSIVVMQKPKNAQKEQVHVMRLRDDKIADDVLAEVLMHKDTSLFDSFNSISPAGGEVWNFKGLEDQSIFDKLVQCSLLLGDIAIVVQAMQTGINEILAPSIATLAKYSIEQELIHPIAKSGSISRFEFDQLQNAIIWTQGIDIDKYPNTKKYLLLFKNALAMRYDIKSRKANWWEISTPRNAELFFSDRPRILVPFMATGNKFCVDDEKRLNDGGDIRGIFFEVNCQYSEFYACAILNSRLCEYYNLRNTKLKRGGYYEYFESQLSALPIHRINFITPPKERAYYLKKAKNLYAYCMSKDDQACVLGFVEHHLSKQPEESDVVHDLLAFLAEEMIRLNKEKRAAMKEFLKWLVTTLKILPDKDGKKGIDVLTEKSKIADYPGDYQKREPALAWEELLDILRKNKSRLGVSLSDMGLVERVRERYEVSLGRVLPLKEQLRRTDGLIDRVVYRLYGLTEDEIKIVER